MAMAHPHRHRRHRPHTGRALAAIPPADATTVPDPAHPGPKGQTAPMPQVPLTILRSEGSTGDAAMRSGIYPGPISISAGIALGISGIGRPSSIKSPDPAPGASGLANATPAGITFCEQHRGQGP